MPPGDCGILTRQVKKTAAGIVFLYTMVEVLPMGVLAHRLAKLAHLPAEIIRRSSVLVDSYGRCPRQLLAKDGR